MLNVLAVILISRELIRSSVAWLLPPLIFTLSAIQFHGFRDSALYEILPAPLFYAWALIHYNNRRTLASLVMLLIFTGLFIANLSYGGLQTSIWWTAAFTLLLALFHPDIFAAASRNVRELGAQPRGRVILGALLFFLVAAFLAFYAPVHYNLGQMVRVPGAGPVPYDTDVYGGFSTGNPAAPLSALSHPIWANFTYWAPFQVVHDTFLVFDDKGGGQKAGVDHRYIGLVTLPLLFAAIFRGYRNRYVLVLLLTAFACSAFIVYTNRNLLITALAEMVPVFRNIRTIADTLPRDAPIILMALTAGIGLDLLVRSPGTHEDEAPQRSVDRLLRGALIGMLLVGGVVLLLALRYRGQHPVQLQLKKALAHVGVYLFLFSLLCLLLVMVKEAAHRKALAMVLLVLASFDLTISATSYWQRGLVWFKNEGPHAVPHLKRLVPVDSTLQTWPGSYGGFINNPFGGPFTGLQSWLPLATRPQWQPLLENWDADLRMVSKYPDFRFYSAGTHIPFDSIKTIDSIPGPTETGIPLYVHDRALSREGSPEELAAKWEVTEFTPNRVRVRVSMPRDGLMVFLDNYERFWSALVDGSTVPVRRANFTFKTIPLSAGDHDVEWKYDPWSVKAFWILFYVALAFVVLAIAGWRVRASVALVSVAVLAWIAFQYAVSWYMADRGNVTGPPGGTARLELKGIQRELRLDEDRKYPVADGTAVYVEGVLLDEAGMTKILGWAIDEIALQPSSSVVITVGDRVWISGKPAVLRPDIATLHPGYSLSGFQIFGRGASDAHLENLRAFGILANGTAVELRYSKGVRHAVEDEKK